MANDSGQSIDSNPLEAVIVLDDPPCKVRLKSNPRSRNFNLRLDPSGIAVLSHPPWVPEQETRAFLQRHAGWLRRALARQPRVIALAEGTELPVDGIPRTVELRPGPRRAPLLEDRRVILQGKGALGPRLSQWLKLRARDRLEPAVRHYAALLDKSVERIALRDTRSRWGSCSTSGTISFSWRLAMAPPEVQDYVAAHEAAHIVEMNHSPAYWAVVERLMPGWKPHRDWLKREGRKLHAYQFNGD